MALTKASYSMINGASLNVLDYGAIADGTWNDVSGVVGGTDSQSAFQAALNDAVTKKIGTVIVPSGLYNLASKITIPASVSLVGQGTMKLGDFYGGDDVAGSILMINGAAGQDCIQFVENKTYSGLHNLSVYNYSTNAIRSVVSVVGVLYPFLSNVSIGCLKQCGGAGLYLSQSATAPNFETLWGEFHNITVASDGLFNHYGLQLAGQLLANNFTGGDYQGGWAALYQTGVCNSHTFTGVKFESSWTGTDTSFVPYYVTQGLFGGANYPAYAYPVVGLFGTCSSILFSGCYIERTPTVITTYNDGVHGVLDLWPVFWNAATASYTTLTNMSWNGVYILDEGNGTVIDQTTAGLRHASRKKPYASAKPTGVAQLIATATFTNVVFNQQNADTDELFWNATTGRLGVTNDGLYLINVSVEITPWTAAGQYLQAKLLNVRTTGSLLDYSSPTVAASGTGQMLVNFSFISELEVGDNPYVQVFQNSGGNLNIVAAGTFIKVVKLN
jgi:hypothetical protein